MKRQLMAVVVALAGMLVAAAGARAEEAGCRPVPGDEKRAEVRRLKERLRALDAELARARQQIAATGVVYVYNANGKGRWTTWRVEDVYARVLECSADLEGARKLHEWIWKCHRHMLTWLRDTRLPRLLAERMRVLDRMLELGGESGSTGGVRS